MIQFNDFEVPWVVWAAQQTAWRYPKMVNRHEAPTGSRAGKWVGKVWIGEQNLPARVEDIEKCWIGVIFRIRCPQSKLPIAIRSHLIPHCKLDLPSHSCFCRGTSGPKERFVCTDHNSSAWFVNCSYKNLFALLIADFTTELNYLECHINCAWAFFLICR